jgi:hypothetical protein
MNTLEELLLQKKPHLLKRWLDLILETYPLDSQRFLKHQKNQFLNPVGSSISKEIETLFVQLIQGMNLGVVSASLERIIKIRAIQDFSPSKAISFIYLLKKLIREEVLPGTADHHLTQQLLVFESRLDEMALLAFDIYIKAREKVYELRANEAKNQVSGLLRQKGLLSEEPIWKQGPDKAEVT